MYISVKNINKTIKRIPILKAVSLEMESGVVYGLWGTNGSGKTMLLRLLAGLIRPSSGVVSIDERRLGRDMDFPDSMGLLIENPAFLPGLTGRENLELLAQINESVGSNTIVRTLRDVGLDPKDPRKFKKYSLGMKQRLGLASVLMESPELILLDEPTNALDTDGCAMIAQQIVLQKQRGALVVVASHDRAFLQEVSDVIIRVENGCVRKEEAL